MAACSSSNNPSTPTKAPGTEQAVADAVDVCIYGYPLVTMDMTRRQMTNIAMPDRGHAPMGQLVRMRTYPAVDDHAVTAPNADTLYTTAWIDVSNQPWVLSVPDMGDRYYLLPMLSGWTDVFQVPGKRTTGGKAATYAIMGPGWSGTLPAGVTEYKSPTGLVWLLGRISCTGTPADYAAVHALQDKFSLVSLFGGVDEKAEHQRDCGSHHAHTHPYDLFGLGTDVACGQKSLDKHAETSASESTREDKKTDVDRIQSRLSCEERGNSNRNNQEIT